MDTPSIDEPLAREARRQQALVAAVLGQASAADAPLHTHFHERDERLRRGLSAYRANAQTIAERALAAAYPTTAALIGADDFAALARALWRAEPPRRGDLAQWGHGLPGFIEAQASLAPWPYLGDVARFDRAVVQCEAAADAELQRDSLALLAQAELPTLHLDLQPSVCLIDSRWPLALMAAAHRSPGAEAFAQMRAAIEATETDDANDVHHPQALAIARSGWRAEWTALSRSELAWMQALAHGLPLDRALDAAQAAGPFDFDAWLIQALSSGWLWRARVVPATHPEQTP